MAKKPEEAGTDVVDSDIAHTLMAESKIKSYTIATVGVSTVPVPLFDIAAVFAIQLRMIQQLSNLYGRPFSERAGRNIITALGGGVLGYGAGFVVAASALKLIPGIGWAVGIASMPLVMGASTYAVGRSIVKHYEEGGSLFDFSADKMRAYYQEQFEKGKELAAKAKAGLKSGGGQATEDVATAA